MSVAKSIVMHDPAPQPTNPPMTILKHEIPTLGAQLVHIA
jgi:hypothetical protein